MYVFIGLIISLWHWLTGKLEVIDHTLPTTNKECLIIYLHGLNGSPKRARSYLSKIKIPATIITPIIPHKGNCSLEVAAEPILEYIQQNNYRTIILIGYSNGSRIAAHIENALPLHINVLFISIAGVHFGTKLMNILDYLYLTPMLNLHPKIVQSFKWRNHIILPNRPNTISHYIVGSMDEKVFPLVKQENQHIIDWCSHTSILGPAIDYAIDLIHQYHLILKAY